MRGGVKLSVESVAVGVRVRDGDTGGGETMLDAWNWGVSLAWLGLFWIVWGLIGGFFVL